MGATVDAALHYPACLERNLALNKEEFAQRKIILESWPTEVMAILTTRCNLKCVHCAREVSNKILPEERAWQIAELFPYLHWVNWQGGEAFLAPYFRKLLFEGARYHRLDQQITTAGVLIDQGWAEVLAQVGASISWSIDGATRETYEKIRVPAKFDRLLRSLDYVREAYAKRGKTPRMDLCACVMRSNYGELEAFLPFAKAHGFVSVGFFPMFSTPYGDNTENIFAGGSSAAAAAIVRLETSRLMILREAEALGITLHWYLPKPKSPEAPSVASQAREFSCARPWNKLIVRVELDSNAYPDCPCPVPAGNILRQTIKEIWNGPGMQEYRRRLRDQTMFGFCNSECLNGFIDPRLRTYSNAVA